MTSTSLRSEGRHRVHVGHLVMGLAFLCLTAGWGLVQADLVTGSDIRWLLPLPWLVAGAVGLAVATTSSLRHTTSAPHDPTNTEIQEQS